MFIFVVYGLGKQCTEQFWCIVLQTTNLFFRIRQKEIVRWHVWFTTVPLKALSNQEWNRYPCYCLCFVVSLQKWLAHFYWRRKGRRIVRIIHFLDLEIRWYFPHYWSGQGFKGLKLINRIYIVCGFLDMLINW